MAVKNAPKDKADIVKKLTQENLALQNKVNKLEKTIMNLKLKNLKSEEKNFKLQKSNSVLQERVAMQESYPDRIARLRSDIGIKQGSLPPDSDE